MNVAIFGLGRFGTQLARELVRMGVHVLAVDVVSENVRAVVDEVSLAAEGDVTDIEFLETLGLDRYDSVVVAIADNVPASVLTTLTLKGQMSHKHVIAKARDKQHRRSLELAGADVVLNPEQEAATRLAHTLGSIGVDDYLSLDGASGIARIKAPAAAHGRALAQFDLLGAHQLILVGRLRDRQVTLNPNPDEHVQRGDVWIVAGNDRDLQKLQSK